MHFISMHPLRTCPASSTHTFPQLSPNQDEKWISLSGICKEREKCHISSRKRNQGKWTSNGDEEGKTNEGDNRGEGGGCVKPFVILNSSNAAEQFHLPSCLQSIISSAAQVNQPSVSSIRILSFYSRSTLLRYSNYWRYSDRCSFEKKKKTSSVPKLNVELI